VVERSIGWIMMHRRLARDYETLAASSEAMIHLASIDNLAKRMTDETTPT
jgi:transposase